MLRICWRSNSAAASSDAGGAALNELRVSRITRRSSSLTPYDSSVRVLSLSSWSRKRSDCDPVGIPVWVSSTAVTYISLEDGLDILDLNRCVHVDGESVSSCINKCEHAAGGCRALAKMLHNARNAYMPPLARVSVWVLTTFHLILHQPAILTHLCDALTVET